MYVAYFYLQSETIPQKKSSWSDFLVHHPATDHNPQHTRKSIPHPILTIEP
ncbi:unnamed protein product [Acidithrix sp. C25]|nr:unnamed protein product [Acidithrix sp. C25]